MKKILFGAFGLLLIGSCKNQSNPNGADTIYYGGEIITMEGDSANYAEAIALKEGKIVFVGSKSEAEKLKVTVPTCRICKARPWYPDLLMVTHRRWL